jgi:hypothetical protein
MNGDYDMDELQRLYAENKELKDENAALKRGIKKAHLYLLASVCDCGEPLKDTDAFDVLDALLEESHE